jgi:hypothetical protein
MLAGLLAANTGSRPSRSQFPESGSFELLRAGVWKMAAWLLSGCLLN